MTPLSKMLHTPLRQTCDICHTSRSLAFATCLDADNTLTTARAPATSFATSKSGPENATRQSNNNISTAPYLTIRSCPPPWPIKYLDRNRNQPQHNSRITLARETMRQRPPPWPKDLPQPSHYHYITTCPIILRPPARPPPWPILPHHLDQTLHNH